MKAFTLNNPFSSILPARIPKKIFPKNLKV